MRKKRLYWTLQIAGWALPAIINIILVTALGETPEQMRRQQFEGLAQGLIQIGVSHFILRSIILRFNWLKIDLGKIIPKIFALIIGAGVLSSIFYQLSYFLVLSVEVIQDKLVAQLTFDFLVTAFLYVIWTTIYFLYHYLESNNRSLKYEAAINEMQLNQLKSQLNPHFIFNALNSVRALVDEEPAKAKIAITQLSNILRTSLIMDKKRVINFNDELNTVRAYLALESIRFEERLKIKYNIDPRSNHFQIPPMMLQTLVENAIKHGVSNLVDGGIIEIKSIAEDSVLKLRIKNSGQYVHAIKKPGKKGGYGISNTKERLKLIYGSEATFNIYNENDKFVITEVRIPQGI
ncbi:sensor histidine kinase [Roseivirga echinicomitans]